MALLRRLALLALVLAPSACDRSSPPEAAPARSAAPSASAAAVAPSASAAPAAPVDPATRAEQLAQRFIILDGHIDVPYRLHDGRDAKGNLTEDVTERTKKGDFDLPRAKAGGLNAPFFSIYVPAKYENNGAKKFADGLIDMVEKLVQSAPDRMEIARSPGDVRRLFTEGKLAVLMGMENGSPIEKKLENLAHFQQRGIRYITLAHSKDNHISDSSYDDRGTNKGLSPFGKKLVAEMNRLGVLIDVSHISDAAFEQVIATTRSPVIASHSSCRHFTPGWKRNMSDEMIKTLAKNGGVIQINFGSDFIDGDLQKQNSARYKELSALLKKQKLDWGDAKAKPIKEQFWQKFEKKYATVEQVADHIDHVVKLVGVDHVGLGSDFDGVGDTLPRGLEDVSKYPNLIRVLLQRGYSEPDIEKLCSGNVLRVWDRVEAFSKNPH